MRGKGSLALAFSDPNDGVRRASFWESSQTCARPRFWTGANRKGEGKVSVCVQNPVCKRDLEDPTNDQNFFMSSKTGGVQVPGF